MQASRRLCVRARAVGARAREHALVAVCFTIFAVACSSSETKPQAGETAIAVGAARQALVSTTTLQVTGDTYVQSSLPNQNFGTDTGLHLQASDSHRTLLFFNPSNITAAVGSGSLVSAHIELTLAGTPANWSTFGNILIHRLKQPSAEGQATWNCALDSNVSNVQADCSGTGAWAMGATDPALQPWLSPTFTTSITNGQTGAIEFEVTTDVAAILAGTDAGHGWLIKKVNAAQPGSVEFASRELGPGPRLVLQIDNAPGGGCTSSASLDVTCNGVDDDCDGSIDEDFLPVCAGSNIQTCAGGSLQQTDCSDGNACNGQETCSGSTGAPECIGEGPPVVDDGNPCTIDACTPSVGVTHTPAANGTSCSDGNSCNGTETCDSSGACVAGTPLSAGISENVCITDTTCDPIVGWVVTYEPLGTPCDSGFICDGAGSCLRDQGGGSLPPPLPPGAASGITAYGLALPRDPVADCALEPIAPDHVALITGTVTTWDPVQQQSVPVPNARITIPERCELGAAWTLVDGTFRFPVNGGEQTAIRIEADADGDGTFDYLPVDRVVEARWRATSGIEDVELVLPAPVSDTLALVGGAVTQDIVLNGPLSEDDRDGDGVAAARTPSVLFKAGTTITGIDADGATVALDTAAIRMTEYTVGEQGAQRMPAPMPPGTAYGYAIELSIDGVEDAYFDQPAVFYVDNFIGAEAARGGTVSALHQVGLPVPAWYYDRHQGGWLKEKDGIIIQLVGVDGSSPPQALIDADGDGDADLADEDYLLARAFVVDVAEREQLAKEMTGTGY